MCVPQLVCIVVSNESDIAAFKDYMPSADEAAAAPAPAADTPAAAAAPAAAAPAASYPEHSLGRHSTHKHLDAYMNFITAFQLVLFSVL